VAIAHAVSQGGPITIDMSFLTFMDSTGVGAILKSAKELATGCIVLHGVHDEVGRVIELMGVDGARQNLHVIPCFPPNGEEEVGAAIEAPDPSL
jgi:anti-anti-sigma regulatory factor